MAGARHRDVRVRRRGRARPRRRSRAIIADRARRCGCSPARRPRSTASASAEVADWLDGGGLVARRRTVGAGKTTTLAALVRALGERASGGVTLEDPIEIVHASPLDQPARDRRARRDRSAAGVASAMREGADAIVVGSRDARPIRPSAVGRRGRGRSPRADHDRRAGRGGRPSTAWSICCRSIAASWRVELWRDALLGTICPVVARAAVGHSRSVGPGRSAGNPRITASVGSDI